MYELYLEHRSNKQGLTQLKCLTNKQTVGKAKLLLSMSIVQVRSVINLLTGYGHFN